MEPPISIILPSRRRAPRRGHPEIALLVAQPVAFDGTILAGSLPTRGGALVAEGATLHAGELAANWQRALAREPVANIDPLP